ncbi:transport protein TonB [Halomonas sp. THAF5a]|uniref:energy transducer TonB n=1 Tax=Halomonas sp. THAF5a TaxID=2587844 RepID=UPI0012678D8B|nr:energy transducer TonB [Halomonas sp. THAF5a]QFU02180.1 transport protein TonB [Halomonas sp. THAF5a]
MIRWPLAGLAGASLALLLFWGLALLVAPPEAEVEMRETTMTMRLSAATESPAEPAAAPAPAPSAPPTPAPAPPSPPPPAPLPASPLTLPEPPADPLPERPEAVAEPDSALPELTEAAPTPEPRPDPAPDLPPEPTPSPEPASSSATSPEATATPSSAASGQEAPSANDGGRQAVQDVGQATPTRRVPPSYPRRAQRRGLEGHVVVEFLIRPDGRVKAGSVRVVEARPRRVFDEAATRAVADWRFEADGRLRRARQRLEFQLR